MQWLVALSDPNHSLPTPSRVLDEEANKSCCRDVHSPIKNWGFLGLPTLFASIFGQYALRYLRKLRLKMLQRGCFQGKYWSDIALLPEPALDSVRRRASPADILEVPLMLPRSWWKVSPEDGTKCRKGHWHRVGPQTGQQKFHDPEMPVSRPWPEMITWIAVSDLTAGVVWFARNTQVQCLGVARTPGYVQCQERSSRAGQSFFTVWKEQFAFFHPSNFLCLFFKLI